MNKYIKIAFYNDNEYGLITEFLTDDDSIKFAYTKSFNNKYTYEFVDDIINNKLMDRYLKDERN